MGTRTLSGDAITSQYRKDIDGLRAIAIISVVAFHLRAPLAGSGFFGVDIFFVVSGFLITGILLRERAELGSVRLSRFWARRARRLLPAVTVTLLATIGLTLLYMPATTWHEVARTALSTLFYGTNVLLGFDSADYFAATARDDPLSHFWSLSVEEQFYVVWPLLIAVTALRNKRFSDRFYQFVVGGIGIVSFAYFLWLTSRNSIWNYYASPARAWEFAIGGLAATFARRHTISGGLANWATSAGLAMIGIGLFWGDQRARFPGLLALWPVFGTALICFAPADPSFWVARILSSPPMRWIGKISYSLYLWHWPLLVISTRSPKLSLSPFELAGASVIAATASFYLVENPIRFLPALQNRPGRNAVGAAGLVVIGLVGVGGLELAARSRDGDPVVQAIMDARDDDGQRLVVRQACESSDVAELIEACAYGVLDSDKTMLLIGDSHADHWEPAFSKLATDLGLRLVVRIQGGCPAIAVRTNIRRAEECAEVQRTMPEVIQELSPDLVVVAHSAGYLRTDLVKTDGQTSAADSWSRAVETFLEPLSVQKIPVLWIEDTPVFVRPLDCLAVNGIEPCRRDQAAATSANDFLRDVEGPVLAGFANVTRYDPRPSICDPMWCSPAQLSGGELSVRYRDGQHLTATFSRSLASEISATVSDLLT